MFGVIVFSVFAISSAWSQVIADGNSSICSGEEWKCRDGSCVSVDDTCDGLRNCPDGSDETYALCRKVQCQGNWFRCAYGACVDGPAPCDGVRDCADNSDELLRRCRGEKQDVRGSFKCDSGQEIPASYHCDGAKDCDDGSDEVLKECAGKRCPANMVQCAYGACVKPGSECDDKEDCADGSDESDDLCNRKPSVTVSSVPSLLSTNLLPTGNLCMLPPLPRNGYYTIAGHQSSSGVVLNISCDSGYSLKGPMLRWCIDGLWHPSVVTNNECQRNSPVKLGADICRLKKDPSVRFRCLVVNEDEETWRECTENEPDGTVVSPSCNTPNYFSKVGSGGRAGLPFMRCIGGNWDYVARCQPECGSAATFGLIPQSGQPAELGEVPWHAGIYLKSPSSTFMLTCSGSLVSSKAVITAANCFWDDVTKAQPASNYAVALGKLHRPWEHPGDTDAQRSDVADIKMTPYFQGRTANYRHDIAIVLLVSVIDFRPHIRPVCVDFSVTFKNSQLFPGNKGKVAGWGVDDNFRGSEDLKVYELPYISTEKCQMDAPSSIRELITGDKFCAGYTDGTEQKVCNGGPGRGGGLAFRDSDSRYYLRGIASKTSEHFCITNRLTTFTQISNHEHFILKNLI